MNEKSFNRALLILTTSRDMSNKLATKYIKYFGTSQSAIRQALDAYDAMIEIAEKSSKRNPAITKEQITETQRKRYAKRRKYTGATAPDKKNPPKSLHDLLKIRGAQATGSMKQPGHYFVQFRDEYFAILGSHEMIAQGLFIHEIRPSTAEAFRNKKNKPYIVEFTLRKSGLQPNPPCTLIYGKTLQIKAQKTQPHHCDAACKRSGHRYVHTFKSNSQIYGLSNGDILISNHKR